MQEGDYPSPGDVAFGTIGRSSAAACDSGLSGWTLLFGSLSTTRPYCSVGEDAVMGGQTGEEGTKSRTDMRF